MTLGFDKRNVLAVALLLALGLLAIFVGLGGPPGNPFAREMPILYLSWDQEDRIQLFRTTASGTRHRKLTEAAQGLLDYAASPDGASIAYSNLGPGGQSQLRLMESDGGGDRTLLDCGQDRCSGVLWAPDGGRLVYERHAGAAGDEEPEQPRLWWLDLQTEETTPLFAEADLPGMAARFSHEGQWLAFAVPTQGVIQLFNFEQDRSLRVPSETGQPVAWHPVEQRLLFTVLQYEGEAFGAHIFSLDVPGGDPDDLSDARAISDSAPAWSPSGEWIAFGRKPWRAAVGRQLWLMRPDGSEKRALTDDLESNFGPPSWSADGQRLLFQRFQVNEPTSRPSIWLLDVETGELQEVADPGFSPSWIP